ncbi:hypothetical protein EJB05_34176, partial [Eragrostis curvula]
MVAVFSFVLFIAGCEAGVVPGGDPPSSSSAAKHGTMALLHVRKLLNISSDANAAAATTEERRRRRRTAAPAISECSEQSVVVSQDGGGLTPNSISLYSVTITNTCMSCTVRDVHVSCGEFASTELVRPSEFRRLAVGDCLVRDGGALGPGETISFEYTNSFKYDMDVASVSCG